MPLVANLGFLKFAFRNNWGKNQDLRGKQGARFFLETTFENFAKSPFFSDTPCMFGVFQNLAISWEL